MTSDRKLPNGYDKVFKPADIRGVYPDQINEELMYRIGRAFIENSNYKKIVVGYDMRLSTPSLKNAFIKGARISGASIVDIGMVRSPMLYFASGHLKLPAAIITASHSPSEYNGVKLVKPYAVPLTLQTGLNSIKKRVRTGVFTDAKLLGTITKKSLRREYRKHILKGVDRKKFQNMVIVSDIGNGMSGVSMTALDRLLPAKFPMLFQKPDGNFPNRDSDPTLRKNQKALAKEIKKKKADFGIGFDGDGDRIAFLDENGRYINCAVIGAVIAKRLLQKEHKGGIVFTNLTSRIFEETIIKYGGKAYKAKVGHTFLKIKMREKKAIFGAEHSGHFFWRDFYNTDSTILTLLEIMKEYAEAKSDGKTFSQMLKPYILYQQTEDVVIHVENKKVALDHIEKKLNKMKFNKITKFDGYFVDFGDTWGAIKPSVTEYAIKLMFESKKKSSAVKIQKELHNFIKSIAGI